MSVFFPHHIIKFMLFIMAVMNFTHEKKKFPFVLVFFQFNIDSSKSSCDLTKS